ncbi:hypothetical protein JHK85_027021 [Glycine max]|nr:hypothetical protein JHK85_027021 [Glycine max]KAG5014271.1 hypothetical protein JHK86_026532 [Glycine max]
MESSSGIESTGGRAPLSGVVADCVKRWFKDTLKEAKAGDVNMQVLVGQMYYHGYGVPRDAQKSTSLKLSLIWCVLREVNVTRPKKEELAFEKKKKRQLSIVLKSQAFVVSVTDVKFKFYLENNTKSTCMRLSFSFVSKADVIGWGMKGRIWLTKASRVRSSVWRVGGKRPGYNASDSESDEEEDS